MPEKMFTGHYVTVYPEFLTSTGSLIGVPGESRDLPAFPDDGRWVTPPPPPPAVKAPVPVAPAPAGNVREG
jgi:hypothetical protein